LINEVVEKPKLSEAPSNYAIIGRYILPKKILSVLKNQKRGKGGEIHITDAIKFLVKRNENFMGIYLKENILIVEHWKVY
jgi:UTP--glucose-1-phosphate uridylyltransferase